MSQEILNILKQTHSNELGNPYFTIQSHNIQILNSPIDYFLALCKGIRISHKRLILTSLYLGDGPLELYLSDLLFNKIDINKDFRLNILLDHSRGRRGNIISAYDTLKSLKSNFHPNHNVRIGFLKNFRPFSKMVNSFQESRGVQHMKMAVFDNNVILTGANLSDSYFTDREDRWIVFKECKELADYCDDLANTMLDLSYEMDDDGNLTRPRNLPKKDKEFCVVAKDRMKLFKYMQEEKPEIVSETVKAEENERKSEEIEEKMLSLYKDGYELGKKLKKVKKSDGVFNVLKDMPEEFNIVHGSGGWRTDVMKTGGLVYLFPTLQMHYLGIDDDLILLKKLIPCFKNLSLASGYMNFPKDLENCLKNVENLSLLTASPYANGFLGDGIKNWIPYMYRALKDRTMKSLPNAQFAEYFKEDWTFHSKGIWAEEPGGVFFSNIGGSNFSNRSFYRDCEFQVYMWTQCPDFKKELLKEKNRLWSYGFTDKNKFPLDYGIPTRILSRLLKSFL